MMPSASRWALIAVVCAVVVDHGSTFTTQVALNRPNTNLLPPTKHTALHATVNGESKTDTTASDQPGFPLHALFNAAARAAVPKAADNAAGGHDAVSE